MNETRILCTLGSFTLTAYGLCVMLGAALAVALTVMLTRRQLGVNSALSLCLAVIPGAVIGARAVYCLTMLDFILVDLGGAGFIPQLWQGGYALYGAVLGGAAGAWLYAKGTRRSPALVLDFIAPGAALTLMAARLAEYFTSQGLGAYIEDEAMMRFPFGVESLYGEWQVPVFVYEALAALIILVVLLIMRRRAGQGRLAETFVILLGLTQIILESWRADEFIRFGFVRFNQLAAAVTLGAVLFLRVFRRVRAEGWRPWQIVRVVLFLAGIVVIILLEFALDKSSIANSILYAVMAATLLVMGVSLLADQKAPARS